MWSGFSAAVGAGGSVFVNVAPPASGSALLKWGFILALVVAVLALVLTAFGTGSSVGLYVSFVSLAVALVVAVVDTGSVSGPAAAQRNTVPVVELSEISGISADLFPAELEDTDRVRISPVDFLVRDEGIYRGNEGVYWFVEPDDGTEVRNGDVVVVEGPELVGSAAETN